MTTATARDATTAEVAHWDTLVTGNPDGGNILQSACWADLKSRHGWRPHRWVVDVDGTRVAVLLLSRHIPGFGALWYAPKGPGVATAEQLAGVLGATAGRCRGFLVKWEPALLATEVAPGALVAAHLRPSLYDVQMRATVIVDLREDDDALIASFKPKTRYNTRLAGRRGVRVGAVTVDGSTTDVMYELMRATEARAGVFALRPRAYYEDYWRSLAAAGRGRLYLAQTADGVVAAGAFVTWMGAHAWYAHGGSRRDLAPLMAPYLLHYEIMRALRQEGVRHYDLVGVPPPAEVGGENTLNSLVQFKTGFANQITEFVGTWDQPLSWRYPLWRRQGERLADAASRRLAGDILY